MIVKVLMEASKNLPVVVTMTGPEAREVVLALEARAEIFLERQGNSRHANHLLEQANAIERVRIGEAGESLT